MARRLADMVNKRRGEKRGRRERHAKDSRGILAYLGGKVAAESENQRLYSIVRLASGFYVVAPSNVEQV